MTASARDLKPSPRSDEELFCDWFTDEEIARLEGISTETLKNRVYSGKNHPPFTGKGRSRRWPKAEYQKWKMSKLQKEVG